MNFGSDMKPGIAIGVASAISLTAVLVQAHATQPLPGAVAKPADFDLGLPFVAGEQVYITSGYGPSGGSSFHDGTNETCCSNDYYALDVVLPNHPDNGRGQPVVAMASGTVAKAGWATGGWASYGQRIYIVHDYNADGNTYTSLYAHLDTIDVAEGDHVDKGQQIGTLGGSSNGSLTGFAFHLHFALHRNSSIGGSGSGGSYGGNAVVPEPIDGYEDLTPGQTLTSQNSAGPCGIIGPQETIIDDEDTCFARFGPVQYWNDETSGYGNHSLWTYTIDGAQPDNYVRWKLHFEQAGDYELWAYVPASRGKSTQARYDILHGGQTDTVTRDQTSAPDGWLHLGTFSFDAGGDQAVALADNTGEPYTGPDGVTIAFDALRIRPAAGPGSPDAGPDAPDGGGSGSPDAGPSGDTDANTGNGADGDTSGGCSSSGSGAGWLVVLLGLYVARRRRAVAY